MFQHLCWLKHSIGLEWSVILRSRYLDRWNFQRVQVVYCWGIWVKCLALQFSWLLPSLYWLSVQQGWRQFDSKQQINPELSISAHSWSTTYLKTILGLISYCCLSWHRAETTENITWWCADTAHPVLESCRRRLNYLTLTSKGKKRASKIQSRAYFSFLVRRVIDGCSINLLKIVKNLN